MIKIVKNNDIKIVTKGAYENFYEPLGYNIVNENKTTITKDEVKKSTKISSFKTEESEKQEYNNDIKSNKRK